MLDKNELVEVAKVAKDSMEQGEKATILQVGYIDTATQTPQDWVFDCKDRIPAISICGNEVRYGGYTIKELYSVWRSH